MLTSWGFLNAYNKLRYELKDPGRRRDGKAENSNRVSESDASDKGWKRLLTVKGAHLWNSTTGQKRERGARHGERTEDTESNKGFERTSPRQNLYFVKFCSRIKGSLRDTREEPRGQMLEGMYKGRERFIFWESMRAIRRAMLSWARILASIQWYEMINDSATEGGNSVDIDDRSIWNTWKICDP